MDPAGPSDHSTDAAGEPGDEPEHDAFLDVRGLNCPLPILRTRARLAGMDTGSRLWVCATDPHSVVDFLAYCEKTPTELAARWEAREGRETPEQHFLLIKGESA